VMGKNVEEGERFRVVVDAGHGGMDPGKVGINGALEKDVNLKIAEALKKYLEAEGVEVVMTRESDDGLYNADASNKKVQDMKRRIELMIHKPAKVRKMMIVFVLAILLALTILFSLSLSRGHFFPYPAYQGAPEYYCT